MDVTVSCHIMRHGWVFYKSRNSENHRMNPPSS